MPHIPHVRKVDPVLPAVIESNLQTGAEAPPIVVRIHEGADYREQQARAVDIDGGSGAHVWVETEALVRLDGEEIP